MKHTCHWDGCEKECPPAMWGCKQHWFTLPLFLRNQIWKEYRAGQEITKTPSTGYLIVAKMVQIWISYYKKGIKLTEQEMVTEDFLKKHLASNNPHEQER